MSRKQEILKDRYKPRPYRVFSIELKKKLVKEIELKRLKPRDVVNLYKVTEASVYRWISEYSSIPRGTKMVVESESQESRTDKLFVRIAELERTIGQKQMEIDFLNKVVNICSDELGYDIKKKCTTTRLNGTE